MKLARWVLLTLTLAIVVACSKGDECDTCTQDSDCTAGYVCSTFSDGSKRCGTGAGASTCRVR